MLEQRIAQEIIRARSAQQGLIKQKVLLNSTQRNRLIRSMLKRKFNLNTVVARPGEERERVSPPAYGKSGHNFLPFWDKIFFKFLFISKENCPKFPRILKENSPKISSALREKNTLPLVDLSRQYTSHFFGFLEKMCSKICKFLKRMYLFFSLFRRKSYFLGFWRQCLRKMTKDSNSDENYDRNSQRQKEAQYFVPFFFKMNTKTGNLLSVRA
jgi:hypothetical protein